ncbi:uncharacterized protein SCHCODRAFT_02487077 [Schizophyllum commune H4-8]|uniref:uncharacterized protein n=1 Tax=Schizophyllum commune (strain H4-8 / FGSC 9210) TaxID=578458 RepID=UPI00215DDAE5|nr:uncharacterized protein SCHCODRAFT_02487077 [Schizophyllum commune H4-8]KAI5898035.1 hypothetical protein SCHCODRAFT_02487077 [Schizophyllum commune H4-8]
MAASLTSQFASTYLKLLQGHSRETISPKDSLDDFYAKLLSLTVDRVVLEAGLTRVSKEACLTQLKPFFNELFASCLKWAREGSPDDPRKTNALQTLSIMIRCVLAKNLSGWEVLEVFGGGVKADAVFMQGKYTYVLLSCCLSSTDARFIAAAIRHQALQVALTFMCGISQLSPGAYFLRIDLFPAITTIITSPETEQFTFEAALLLAILANYHKSDAATLNPYNQSFRNTKDRKLMEKICWASNYALNTAIKAYQAISDDDTTATLTNAFGSLVTSWSPNRAFASKQVDAPRELFKDQPIEGSVILLPVYEFPRQNSLFLDVLLKDIRPEEGEKASASSPLLLTVLSFASYVLTHATSIATLRSLGYANLVMNVLLNIAENDKAVKALCEPSSMAVRLCRQRQPLLPAPKAGRTPLCALLDCCVLWLRHNLHKRIEAHMPALQNAESANFLMWICHRIVWDLQVWRTRLDYHWSELWAATLGLLTFLSTKLGDLATTGEIEALISEASASSSYGQLKALTLRFLPTPEALHVFIYELVRSADSLKKQAPLLKDLALPPRTSSRRRSLNTELTAAEKLARILNCVEFYATKISEGRARSANQAMRIVAREVDADGLQGVGDGAELEPPYVSLSLSLP